MGKESRRRQELPFTGTPARRVVGFERDHGCTKALSCGLAQGGGAVRVQRGSLLMFQGTNESRASWWRRTFQLGCTLPSRVPHCLVCVPVLTWPNLPRARASAPGQLLLPPQQVLQVSVRLVVQREGGIKQAAGGLTAAHAGI